jgi:mannose-1-phosphate guanylyltransferase/phosphomannomutase
MLRDGAEAVILGVRVPDPSNYGVLLTDQNGWLVDFKEKQVQQGPAIVDAGFYLFSRKFLSKAKQQSPFSLEYDVFPHANNVAVVEHSGPWHDVGTVSRLRVARGVWGKSE